MNLQANGRKAKAWQIALVLLGLAAVCFGVFRVVVRMRVRSRIDTVRAAGYPIALAELDAWYEKPGLAGNAANYVTEAFTHLRIPKGEEREPLPLFGNTDLPAGAQPFDEETLGRVDTLLAENADAIKLLHQMVGIEESRYPVDFTQGHGVLLMHLGEMSKTARLLALEAAANASRGRADSAARSIVCGYALARSLLHEPSAISQMVRGSCDAIATEALQYILNRSRPAEESLSELDRAIQAACDPNAMARALVGERCLGHEAFRNPRSLGLDVVSHSRQPSLVLVEVQRAMGTLDLNWAAYLDMMEEYIEAAVLSPHERLRAAEAVEARHKTLLDSRSMARYITPPAVRLISVDLADLARLLTARTAVAVERYRLTTGQLPGQLGDLVPGCLDDTPLDPFDGRPLRYGPRREGYMIYSIGPDEADDGGTERPARRRGQEQPNYDITFIVER